MALLMNLNAGGLFSVPRGFPIRLVASGESALMGVIPRGVSSVTATLATEIGLARAHLALMAMPTSSGGGDQAIVAQTDLVGLTSKAGQSFTVSVPAGALPACYVVKLWVDSITGTAADAVSRDGSTATTSEPKIPTGVLVSSVAVS